MSLTRRIISILAAVAIASSSPSGEANAGNCPSIDTMTLKHNGEMVGPGLNDDGYNHEEGTFREYYCKFKIVLKGFYYKNYEDCKRLYPSLKISMKWSQEWLSNEDCDGDGELDRHFGFKSYIGSRAWLEGIISGTSHGATVISKYVAVAKPYESFNCRVVNYNVKEEWKDFCVVYNEGITAKKLMEQMY